MNSIPNIVLADDHVMLRKGLAALLGNLGYNVLFMVSNGKELIQKIEKGQLPDIVLMDINMPEMDGFEATEYLTTHFPSVNVLALSMLDDEVSVIRMIKNGARGYVLKEAEPMDLKVAIDNVLTRGYHHSDMVTGKLMHSMHDKSGGNTGISEREKEFLKLAATEMTYKQIAVHMHISPRTVDGYREMLFEKLHVKSRTGLVLFAMRQHLVS